MHDFVVRTSPPDVKMQASALSSMLRCVCRGFPWCRPRWGRSPITGPMVLSWKQRMMGCVNLPHDPVAPALKPNVLIINRPVNKGRGFLNIAETVTSLKVCIGPTSPILSTPHPAFPSFSTSSGFVVRRLAINAEAQCTLLRLSPSCQKSAGVASGLALAFHLQGHSITTLRSAAS